MQVADHACREQQSVSDLFIAAPPELDGEGNGLDLEEAVTTGAGWNSDCFAHVPDRCNGPFEHTPLLIVVEVIEPVGVADKFGNETVGQGHCVMLPGRLKGVNTRPAAWASACGFRCCCDHGASGQNLRRNGLCDYEVYILPINIIYLCNNPHVKSEDYGKYCFSNLSNNRDDT